MKVKNCVVIGPKEPEKYIIPAGLTIKHDPRPRCTLVLGDGFTQSFLSAYDLRDKVKCSIDNLIPAPEGAVYLPINKDMFPLSGLWDSKKWPKIFHYYNETNYSGRNFFSNMSKTDINTSLKDGLWSLSTNSLA